MVFIYLTMVFWEINIVFYTNVMYCLNCIIFLCVTGWLWFVFKIQKVYVKFLYIRIEIIYFS